jgi:hypothetical protein
VIEFRYVPDAYGFCAGSDGTLWTHWRRSSGPGCGSGTPLVLSDGWTEVTKSTVVIPSRDYRRFRRYVLICEAFHGLKPSPKLMCCHRDDDKSNNRPDNLYWGTSDDNHDDAIANGLLQHGNTHWNAYLNEDMVRTIRRLHQEGATVTELAKKYQVHKPQISRILSRKKWGHVQ